jgi:SAM-dependent methyltransferase
MATALIYNDSFYDLQREGSFASAMAVLPVVFDFVSKPRTIVDVGCGVGTWLAAAKKLGVESVYGFDGSWVRGQKLMIAPEEIIEANLESAITFDRRYDLAVSLEVAEHLSFERSGSFVDDLCRASDVVLFGAAPPGQDGDGHINEQPVSYWAKLFITKGYLPLDVVRPVIAHNKSVNTWYRTNTMLFAEKERAFALLKTASQAQLANLDLPWHCEAVGLKNATASFLSYAANLLYWSRYRLREKLGLGSAAVTPRPEALPRGAGRDAP